MKNRNTKQSNWKSEQKCLREAIGYKLQLKRDEKNLSQQELSGMTGISASYISVIERGGKSVSFFYIFKLAKALQASLDELAEIECAPLREKENGGKRCSVKRRRVMELLDQFREEELDLVYYEILKIRKTDSMICERLLESAGQRQELLQIR